MRAGRADAAAYADAWRGDAGSEPISRVAAERMQYGGMSQREVFQGNKDWLRALGPYTGSFGSDSTLPLNLGGVNSPEMLFATDRSILQNRGANDFQWSKVVNGQQIVTRETRLGVDDYLDYAQSYVSQRFNEMDDIAGAAGSSTSSRVFAAGTYGLRRIAEHTINGLIGIPRLATSPTLVPSLIRAVANPTRTATALATQFRGMATQDKIVFGLEAALPFKGRIEGLAGRVPGAGKYLQGTLGYSQNYGITLSANGKLYGSISDVQDSYFRGPLGGQRGAVAIGRFGEIKNGSVSNADVLDPVTQVRLDRYVAAVNSNAPWKWREIDPKITQRERAAIREYAYAQELVPRIPVDPITRYADFSSVVLREASVPKSLWYATDRQQFLYLDNLIGGRPTGTTWHHHQDPGRTQLVPLGVHNITSHSGGRTTWSLGPR